MKKLIMMSVFALGTITSFAGNTEKCVQLSSCQQFYIYYEIIVEEWFFPGGGALPWTTQIYSEKGWFTAANLESRKTQIKSQYTDTFTNGTGSKYHVFSNNATPPVVPFH